MSAFPEHHRQAIIVSARNRKVPLHGYQLGSTVYYIALESYHLNPNSGYLQPGKFTLIGPTGERSPLTVDSNKISDNKFEKRTFELTGESYPSVTMICQFYPYGIKFDLSGLSIVGNFGVRNKYKVLIEIGTNSWLSNTITFLSNASVRSRITDDPSSSPVYDPFIIDVSQKSSYPMIDDDIALHSPFQKLTLEERVVKMELFLKQRFGYQI